jgi:hypothetical protein
VPYPFWWSNVWFPGFFVLGDFDVPVFVNGHACFVTNHYFDRDHDRFTTINAYDRFHSSTFVHRRAVVGPAVVSAGAQTSFKRFRSGTVNRHFGARNGAVVARRTGNVRMHSPVRSGSVVPQENRTFRTAPNTGNWGGQRNRSYGTYAPSQRSNTVSRPMANNRAFGRENAMSRQFDRSPRTYTPPASSYSAPTPREVSPSFGSGRPFEGFRGGSFGGRRWR